MSVFEMRRLLRGNWQVIRDLNRHEKLAVSFYFEIGKNCLAPLTASFFQGSHR